MKITYIHIYTLLFSSLIYSQSPDILLNGTVSAEDNQIKNVADPTDDGDAVNNSYLLNLFAAYQIAAENQAALIYQTQIDSLQSQINAIQLLLENNNSNIENIPVEGLVAYYPFSANANDESGFENHGTVNGATLTNDRFNNPSSAYSFDGISNYIHSEFLINGQSTMTYSFWAKTTETFDEMSVITQDCGDDCYESFALVLNKFLNSAVVCEYGHMETSPQSFAYAQAAHYGAVNTETANSGWKHYALVIGSDNNFSYANFKLYVNGIQYDTSCDHNWGGWEYSFPNYPLVIGKGNESIMGSFFEGEIDDIAIWSRALSDEEIANLYDL